MENGLSVKAGEKVEVTEYTNDWCWCKFGDKVSDVLYGLMCRKVIFPQTL